MKTVKIIIVALLAIVLGSNSYAQGHDHSQMGTSKPKVDPQMEMAKVKVVTIKVWGECETCKVRIEKAAKLDGVTNAIWNKDTKILSLVYNPSQISSDNVQKKIAAVGHDTEKFTANDKAYAKLNECCKYTRRINL